MTTLTFRCLTITTCAVIAVVVSAGCDNGQVGGAGSAGATPTAPSSGTSGSPPVPAPASVPPSAQDGTNYRACLGGDCEISVSKPVTVTLFDSAFEGGPFTVRKVNAGSVEVRMITPAGPGLDTTIEKGCTTTFYANAASGAAVTSCSGERKEDVAGMYVKQMVTVKDITDGTAILILESA